MSLTTDTCEVCEKACPIGDFRRYGGHPDCIANKIMGEYSCKICGEFTSTQEFKNLGGHFSCIEDRKEAANDVAATLQYVREVTYGDL